MSLSLFLIRNKLYLFYGQVKTRLLPRRLTGKATPIFSALKPVKEKKNLFYASQTRKQSYERFFPPDLV